MPLVTSTTRLDWANADRDYKRGQNLIRKGDWANGFKMHELRSLPDALWNKSAKFPGVKTNFDRAPVWMPGQSIRSRNVIIWSEAGWGDMLQFSRFIPLIRQIASGVHCVYPENISSLLKRMDKSIPYSHLTRECPPSSYRVKMMSLPYLLMEHGLLKPEPVDRWYGAEGVYRNPAIEVPKRSKPLVGIFYSTDNKSWNMAAKQIPKDIVNEFIERHTEVDWVSLQLGDGFLNSPFWTETADKLQTLDAVVSVDSAIAHCAASVGVRTINLVGDETMACWRWYPVSERTYWYDSMTTVWWDNYSDWDTGLEKAMDYLDVPKPIAKKRGRPKKSVV
jgi:hypothetical protein